MKKLNSLSMYDEIKRASEKYEDNYIFTYSNTKIKYSVFIKKVDECASAFKTIGVTDKDIVTLIINNSIESIISIYALNKLGITCSLINTETSVKEIEKIITKTKSKYIVISDTKLNLINNNNYSIITIPDSDRLNFKNRIKYIFSKNNNSNINVLPFYRFILKGKKERDKIKSKGNKDSISVIINNNSKNIMLSNNNINSYVLNSKINTRNNNIIFSNYNITDSYGISLIHKSLINGYNLILNNTISDIFKYKPNILECNPILLSNLVLNRRNIKKDLSFIKYIICGQDYLNESLRSKINNTINAVIITNYGLRECTSNVTINYDKYGIGNAINNTNIKIFKEDSFDECDCNEIGEICINGSTVMIGYLDKDQTDKVLKKHKGKIWLRTNDLGYYDESGNIFFKSSKKRIIISDGYNIYPNDIENILLSHKYIKSCIAVGVPHPYKKEVIKVYIVLKDNLVLNSEIKKSIKKYCEDNIPTYALPYAYGYRKELPKNINGKVAYQELINTKEEN